MPIYYFHVEDKDGRAIDPEGLDLPTLEDARRAALDGARDILATQLLSGSIDLDGRIDVHDAADERLFSLEFAQCVTIAAPSAE